jgi:hypothetical protein
MWVQGGDDYNFENDSFVPAQVGQSMASIPMEWSSASFGNMNNVEFDSLGLGECANNCGTVGYPYSLRLTQDASGDGVGGPTQIWFGTFVGGGIEEDGNGISNFNNSVPAIFGGYLEQPTATFINIDNRNGVNPTQPIQLHDIFLQDNFHGAVAYYLSMTDNNPNQAVLEVQSDGGAAGPYGPPVSLNKYFVGTVNAQAMTGAQLPYGHMAAMGVVESQGTLDAELRGEGAGFGPQVIPYTTLPVAPSSCAGYPTGWNCALTLTQGILDPTGGTNAVQVSTNGAGYAAMGYINSVYYAGDKVLYGAWISPGPSGTVNNDNINFSIQPEGASVWSGVYSNNYGGWYTGDWWHPVVAEAICTASGGTQLQFRVVVSNSSINVYQPFWILIPGPNNPAYNGVTQGEVERWRQQLLHATVPQNYTGGTGHAATTAPIDAPGFNILNPSTGAVTPLKTGNLADWTNSGASAGEVATCTAVTSGVCTAWAPGAASTMNFSGALSGDVTGTQTATSVGKINGAPVPAGAAVLGTNSSGQPVAAVTTGSGSAVLATSPTLTTPALGTPSAVVLTNATGLPLASGVTGTLPTSNGGTGNTALTFPNGTATITQTIASGTATLGTSAIASGVCASTVTATATGAATTDTLAADFNASPTAYTGYGVSATGAVLTIYKWVTSNTVNFAVCNSTGASITPSAATLNWRVTR